MEEWAFVRLAGLNRRERCRLRIEPKRAKVHRFAVATDAILREDGLNLALVLGGRLSGQSRYRAETEQHSLPHSFAHYYIEMRTILSLLILSSMPAPAQTPAPLAFDVASIKPSEPITPAMVASGKIHVGMKIDGARVDIGNFPLMQIICKAYGVSTYQVAGPPWLITGQKFDIVATLPKGATKEQVPQMLQSLLTERFKLIMHRETKEAPVYALVVGKGGSKLKESAPPPAVEAGPEGAGPNGATGSNSVSISTTKGGAVVSDGEGTSQKMTMAPDGKTMRLEISGVTMAKLAESTSPMLDRPIMDMTGLTGKFDVTLDLSMADIMSTARKFGANVPPTPGGAGASGNPADSASDPGGSIFTAFSALGLKLEARKLPLEKITIDSIEKMPTEN